MSSSNLHTSGIFFFPERFQPFGRECSSPCPVLTTQLDSIFCIQKMIASFLLYANQVASQGSVKCRRNKGRKVCAEHLLHIWVAWDLQCREILLAQHGLGVLSSLRCVVMADQAHILQAKAVSLIRQVSDSPAGGTSYDSDRINSSVAWNEPFFLSQPVRKCSSPGVNSIVN